MVLKKQGIRQQLNRFCQMDHLFLVAWIIYLLCVTVSLSAWKVVNGGHVFAQILDVGCSIAHVLFGAVVVLNLIAGRYSKRAFVFLLTAGIIVSVGWFFNRDITMMLHVLIMAAAYGADGRKVLKSGLIAQAAVVLTIILLAVSGVTENYLFEPDGRARYSLGFGWATFAPGLLFFLFLAYVQLRKEKITWAELGAAETVAVILYIFTDTKMSFILLSAVILFLAIQKVFRYKWKWILPVSRHGGKIVVGASLLSIVLPLLPQGKIYQRLNGLLSNRLVLGRQAITNYALSPFGKSFNLIGHSIKDPDPAGYNYIDSAYLQMLLKFGVLFFIVGVTIYVMGIRKANERGDRFLSLAFLIIALYGMTDAILFSFSFNIFPVLVFCDEDPLDYFKFPRLPSFLGGKRKKENVDVTIAVHSEHNESDSVD